MGSWITGINLWHALSYGKSQSMASTASETRKVDVNFCKMDMHIIPSSQLWCEVIHHQANASRNPGRMNCAAEEEIPGRRLISGSYQQPLDGMFALLGIFQRPVRRFFNEQHLFHGLQIKRR
ncbi:hypothetical protein CDAR_517021 [Caerostris darwini]|uniref:Uncharacterized protein n=1 Tax=Caerostris darwini TaxID=1538125 RepID=A0AAV4UDW1_9ARAC|nr:hypothetical protein CDAR_517021 [Caerostris darwini]